MLSAVEIARGTQGAVKLLQLDPAAPYQFDNTPQACLRSFRVMALAAPLYAFYVLLHYTKYQAMADDWEILLVETLHYIVDWLFYPVIFYEIARRRGWLGLYPRYVAILNWINLPAIVVAVMGMAISMVTPEPIPSIVMIALQGLFFFWFVVATRLTLGVNWLIAGILLVVNFMPTLFLSLIVDRILGAVPLPG